MFKGASSSFRFYVIGLVALAIATGTSGFMFMKELERSRQAAQAATDKAFPIQESRMLSSFPSQAFFLDANGKAIVQYEFWKSLHWAEVPAGTMLYDDLLCEKTDFFASPTAEKPSRVEVKCDKIEVIRDSREGDKGELRYRRLP